MRADDPHTDRDTRIADEARDWLVRLSTGPAPQADRIAFEAWRAADPDHAAAYRRAAKLWDGVAEMDALKNLEPLDKPMLEERVAGVVNALEAGWRKLIRPPAWGPAVAGLAAGAAAVALIVAPANTGPKNAYRTGVAEISEVTLPDGSVVTLGARSAIDIDFTPETRRVTLADGEAFFEVSKDASRPFIVAAGDAVVRVVGTKFNINRTTETVRVDVLEGVVEVSRPAAADAVASSPKEPAPEIVAAAEPEPAPAPPIEETQVITAGQKIVAAAAEPLHPVETPQPSEPGAWRNGRLVYYDATLAEVIADANRYYTGGQIVFASPALAEMRLTASFRTDEIDALIDTIDDALAVEVDRGFGRRVVLRAEAG